MREIGAFEAKNKLSNLLDQVEQGAEIVITQHGQPVAKLVPACEKFNVDKAKAAAERIRERAKNSELGTFRWADWKKYRDEGRA